MARLVEAYLGAKLAGTSPEVTRSDLEALERTLAALHARGRAAFPNIVVDDVAFAAHLRRCGAAVEGPRAAGVHAEDLYLCCAGLLGDETAVRLLRDRNRAALADYLRPIDASPAFFEDVEQRFWTAALMASAEAPPKLASYAGRGPLAAWVGVAAQRIALTLRRREATEKRALHNVAAEADRVPRDPELAFVKGHLRDPFQRAIVRALDSLDARQRMIYTLHVADGLNFAQIAEIYGVNGSTVSRWMATARDAVLTAARRQLRVEMNVSAGEFESLVRLLSSQLDLSISEVLRKTA